MGKLDQCLAQVRAIHSVAAGVESPYVARSRIGRLATLAASLVAERCGVRPPDLPRPIRVDGKDVMGIVGLAECCNRICDLARHISQPSEPLDERWKRGWEDLVREVGMLERYVKQLREEGRAC